MSNNYLNSNYCYNLCHIFYYKIRSYLGQLAALVSPQLLLEVGPFLLYRLSQLYFYIQSSSWLYFRYSIFLYILSCLFRLFAVWSKFLLRVLFSRLWLLMQVKIKNLTKINKINIKALIYFFLFRF
jgi:hypothetical protein